MPASVNKHVAAALSKLDSDWLEWCRTDGETSLKSHTPAKPHPVLWQLECLFGFQLLAVGVTQAVPCRFFVLGGVQADEWTYLGRGKCSWVPPPEKHSGLRSAAAAKAVEPVAPLPAPVLELMRTAVRCAVCPLCGV